MAEEKHDPLQFLSYLFEIAVFPFQTVAKYEAQHQSPLDQQYLPLLLFPAFLIFIPLCLLICVVAMAYVFFVVPIVFVIKLERPLIVIFLGLAVLSSGWALSQVILSQPSWSIGPSELILAGLSFFIVLGHQLPRLIRQRFPNLRV